MILKQSPIKLVPYPLFSLIIFCLLCLHLTSLNILPNHMKGILQHYKLLSPADRCCVAASLCPGCAPGPPLSIFCQPTKPGLSNHGGPCTSPNRSSFPYSFHPKILIARLKCWVAMHGCRGGGGGGSGAGAKYTARLPFYSYDPTYRLK